MGKQKIRGKDLKKIGYLSDKSKSIAISIMSKHFKFCKKEEKLNLLIEVKENPNKFIGHESLNALAEEFLEVVEKENYKAYKIQGSPKPYRVFGKQFISQNTINQMDLAMQIPVAEVGALMPDAHVGYGLPIGGVLATKNEVIPYAVGLDIGCRMSITIFESPYSFFENNSSKFKQHLKNETHFGVVKKRESIVEHEILDSADFNETKLLRGLKNKAAYQIGTSGSGNHFVEFGEVTLGSNNALGLPTGNYIGLVSHSGSRGLGATIANYYTKIAMDVCRLPNQVKHLAWLDLNKEEGMEYWLSMNLAGEYAKACHDVIHQKLSDALGLKPIINIENHHNFAWQESQINGDDLIVHRKGSTPAGFGEFGFIPGSMTAPGFIVKGKGNSDSLNSASHGAGRKMSRSKAKNSYTKSALKQELKKEKVTLIGGGVDEAPIAYKDIEKVMGNQKELVEVVGKFQPKLVRMSKD